VRFWQSWLLGSTYVAELQRRALPRHVRECHRVPLFDIGDKRQHPVEACPLSDLLLGVGLEAFLECLHELPLLQVTQEAQADGLRLVGQS
jgi:hypothetical protein